MTLIRSGSCRDLDQGKRDYDKLKEFLDRYAPSISRVPLRYAIEKFGPTTRKNYLGLARKIDSAWELWLSYSSTKGLSFKTNIRYEINLIKIDYLTIFHISKISLIFVT